MPGKFSHRYLIRRFLQFQYLLVNELAFLVHHEVRIQWTFICWITRRSLTGADPRKCDARYSAADRQCLRVLAISTLYVQCCSFRGECRGTNDYPRYADEVRYVGRIKISDGDLRDGGV